MSKFFQLKAEVVLLPGVDTMILTHTVSNLNWLYQPKYSITERTQHGEAYADFPPADFRVLIFSPLAPTKPFVINRFQLTGTDLRVAASTTIWGYKDKVEVWGKCPVECSVRILISGTVEQAYEREPPLP